MKMSESIGKTSCNDLHGYTVHQVQYTLTQGTAHTGLTGHIMQP